MNKLIWLNEKDLNMENNLISSLKEESLIGGCYCSGDFNFKPLTFEGDEENFVVNWSGEKNKVDFYISLKYKNSFCRYYYYLIYYGEWGEIEEKPIIFMQLKSDKEKIKSKRPFKIKEILKFIKKNKKIKLSIYFEPTIQIDPEKKEYNKNNNIWISNMGGLYHVIDPGITLKEKNTIKYEYKEWKMGEKSEIIKDYCNWEEYIKICEETAITSKELKKNNQWKVFKHNI